MFKEAAKTFLCAHCGVTLSTTFLRTGEMAKCHACGQTTPVPGQSQVGGIVAPSLKIPAFPAPDAAVPTPQKSPLAVEASALPAEAEFTCKLHLTPIFMPLGKFFLGRPYRLHVRLELDPATWELMRLYQLEREYVVVLPRITNNPILRFCYTIIGSIFPSAVYRKWRALDFYNGFTYFATDTADLLEFKEQTYRGARITRTLAYLAHNVNKTITIDIAENDDAYRLGWLARHLEKLDETVQNPKK